MLISSKQKKILINKGFNLKDIFLSKEELHKKYILNNFSKELSLNKEYKKLKEIYEKIRLKTSDVGLQSSLQAQTHKQLKWISNFEKKIIREKKRECTTSLNQIDKLKEQLFPNNKLQERNDNFFQHNISNNDKLIEIIKGAIDPLSANFVVLEI